MIAISRILLGIRSSTTEIKIKKGHKEEIYDIYTRSHHKKRVYFQIQRQYMIEYNYKGEV